MRPETSADSMNVNVHRPRVLTCTLVKSHTYTLWSKAFAASSPSTGRVLVWFSNLSRRTVIARLRPLCDGVSLQNLRKFIGVINLDFFISLVVSECPQHVCILKSRRRLYLEFPLPNGEDVRTVLARIRTISYRSGIISRSFGTLAYWNLNFERKIENETKTKIKKVHSTENYNLLRSAVSSLAKSGTKGALSTCRHHATAGCLLSVMMSS